MEDILYKASHVNHPSNLWTRASLHNYAWLYEMWCHLHEEFKIRYDYYMKHKSHIATWKTKKPDWYTVGMVA